jgi:YD repeat-containing protein
MHDPDMSGSTDVNNAAYWWTYTYDAAGNLVTQQDARGTVLWFGYDALNRLQEKRLTSSTGTLLAKYYYDETGYGASKGRRTRSVAYVSGVVNKGRGKK